MTKDEALKLALEAIEFVHDTGDTQTFDMCYAKPALAAIKKALAHPEQEPVGQLLEDAFGRGQVMWFNKPKDESMLYTTPPQRTWVELTDEEILEIASPMFEDTRYPSTALDFARAIEKRIKTDE